MLVSQTIATYTPESMLTRRNMVQEAVDLAMLKEAGISPMLIFAPWYVNVTLTAFGLLTIQQVFCM
jgi:hypothetical protein